MHIIAVWVAKLAYLYLRLTKNRGTSLPGKLALKICPDILKVLFKKFSGKTIVVCGTNGKTTTNNLINYTLIKKGFKTVCNSEGANLINGICTAYVLKCSLFGRLKADYACIESDEATLPLLFGQISPDFVVVTNLFSDQLDRYGGVDTALSYIKKAIESAPDATLVLNADEPVTSVLGIDKKAFYYGMTQEARLINGKQKTEAVCCPLCQNKLSYSYYMYGHLGGFSCPECGYQNPEAYLFASDVKVLEGILCFTLNDKNTVFKSKICALYNVYNMLAAVCVLDRLGIDAYFSAKAFLSYTPQPGRMNSFNVGDKKVYLMLSKNTIGFNQSITTLINDKIDKDIMMVLNDRPSDGKDISWIWDVDFESMDKPYNKRYILSGERRLDLQLRLKYAGINRENIIVKEDIKSAIDTLLNSDKKLYYVLVNYTAMYPVYLELSRLEGRKK